MKETDSLFTLWIPDPVGTILGTGYYRFSTEVGVHGLAKIVHIKDRTELDILAVDSERKGKGQLRSFITETKKRFDSISIWEILNPVVGKILASYQFLPARKVDCGETIIGWRWIK